MSGDWFRWLLGLLLPSGIVYTLWNWLDKKRKQARALWPIVKIEIRTVSIEGQRRLWVDLTNCGPGGAKKFSIELTGSRESVRWPSSLAPGEKGEVRFCDGQWTGFVVEDPCLRLYVSCRDSLGLVHSWSVPLMQQKAGLLPGFDVSADPKYDPAYQRPSLSCRRLWNNRDKLS